MDTDVGEKMVGPANARVRYIAHTNLIQRRSRTLARKPFSNRATPKLFVRFAQGVGEPYDNVPERPNDCSAYRGHFRLGDSLRRFTGSIKIWQYMHF